jgi:glycine/D-amino acid oxidase-like deaminating enzyme
MILDKRKLFGSIADTMRSYDVVVAGGGPAGVGAALSAAMNGARVAILEARSQFGGTATAALWMNINWLFSDDKRTFRGGVHDTLVAKIRSFGDMASVPGKRNEVDGGNLSVHPEYTKQAIFELFEEHGIDYRLYSPVTGVIQEDSVVNGVKVTGKEGVSNFRGKVTVDATGEGDVAHLAGCRMTEGREEDGRHMPMSLVFALADVDTEKAMAFYQDDNRKRFLELVGEERKKGEYLLTSWYGFDHTTIPGVISVNNGGCANLSLDANITGDLTAMERLGIELATEFVRFVRDKRIPGLENARLMRTGSHVAVRDTRRLSGEYILQEKDVIDGTEFPDRVARKYGAIDAVGFTTGVRFKQGAAYPFRSMLPREVENLLVTGRCGSATFIAHSAGKSMGNMLDLGQGAGVCAALAARDGILVRDVNVAEAQEILRGMDVPI